MATYAGRAIGGLSVRELKSLLADQGVAPASGLEKHELCALVPTPLSFARVRADAARFLRNPLHDDGSYTPLLVRFAWHANGTYDKRTNTGGSDGGTIWRDAEIADPDNAGLGKARAWRRPVELTL